MMPYVGENSLETQSPAAFAAATEGLKRLETYASSRAVEDLHAAYDSFAEALREDPEFVRANYFKGILLDLLGKPKEAIAVLTPLGAKGVEFADEIEYTLALAHFHQYSQDDVMRSIELYTHVLESTNSDLLRLMARAGLARCFGMMILHSRKTDTKRARNYYRKARKESDFVLNSLAKTRGHLSSQATREIKWRAYNARGVASMFVSDLEKIENRIKNLNECLNDFKAADESSSDNWEIVCNLGSANMRLAYLRRKQSHREEARKHLNEAVRHLQRVSSNDGLRPNYGFAEWEIGRAYRLQGELDKAEEHLLLAQSVPSAIRNVSDDSVKKELDRVAARDEEFYL